jgi:hypothetical protein
MDYMTKRLGFVFVVLFVVLLLMGSCIGEAQHPSFGSPAATSRSVANTTPADKGVINWIAKTSVPVSQLGVAAPATIDGESYLIYSAIDLITVNETITPADSPITIPIPDDSIPRTNNF